MTATMTTAAVVLVLNLLLARRRSFARPSGYSRLTLAASSNCTSIDQE
jgi:hypothetical protein